jgi:transposase
VAGLVDRPRPGRPPRLSGAELDDLIEIVEVGPDVETDGVVRWRCADLAGVVADRFGVTLSERSVGRRLTTAAMCG